MAKSQAILNEARSLPAEERRELAALLIASGNREAEESDLQVGKSGLASWKESVEAEDWSRFYPCELQKKTGSVH